MKTHKVTMYYDIKIGARLLSYGTLWEVTKTEHEVYGFTDKFIWYLKEVVE